MPPRSPATGGFEPWGTLAGFATPPGYQTHLMVYGLGGYRFADYLRIGLPLDLMEMAVAVALTRIFFPFQT